MKLDCLLVSPRSGVRIYQSLTETYTAIEPPVWCGLIATYLRKKSYSVEILDCEAESIDEAEAAARIHDASPLIAAIVVYGHQPSASTQMMPSTIDIAKNVYDLGNHVTLVVLGGHPSALPERTLRETCATYVVQGEGVVSLAGLVEMRRADSFDCRSIPGVWYWTGVEEIGFTRLAANIAKLDEEFPMMPWDLLPMEKYRTHNWHAGYDDDGRKPFASFYGSLGCSFRCRFCCIQSPFKSGERHPEVNSYRMWKPETVVGWIDTLVNDYGIRNIKMADEMAILNRRHVEGISDLLIQRKYDLNIWAYARVDTVRGGMLPKLREAGFRWLGFGIEAGNARVRDEQDKSFSDEEIHATLEDCRANDISVGANYILGLPEDDADTMQETLDLAKELNTEYANWYCAVAYPGSELYADALKQGWELPDSWSGYSQHARDFKPLPTKHVSAKEVLTFRDKAFHEYFESSRYLDMLGGRFGEKAVAHVRKMCATRLERDLLK